MASRRQGASDQPMVYVLVAEDQLAALAGRREQEPLGPLAEPEPLMQSASRVKRPYGPRAAARGRAMRGFFLDRYAY